MLNSLAFFVRIVRLPRPFPPEDVWGRAKRKQTWVMIRFLNCIGRSPNPRNRRPTVEPEKASQGARAELDIALSGPRTAPNMFAAVVRIRHSPDAAPLRQQPHAADGLRRYSGPGVVAHRHCSTRRHAALRSSIFGRIPPYPKRRARGKVPKAARYCAPDGPSDARPEFDGTARRLASWSERASRDTGGAGICMAQRRTPIEYGR
jgi:hypothetical protein